METVDGIELLLDAGLDRRGTGSAEGEISTGGGQWAPRQVMLLRHSPSPRAIERTVTALRPRVDGLLFVVPRAGRALKIAAERDHRIAYSAVDEAAVCFQGEMHRADEQRSGGPTHSGRT